MEQEFTQEELVRGRNMFHMVFGPDYGEELSKQLQDGEFNKILMCRIAPEIWGLDSVDIRTKILCVIAVCTAQKLDVEYFIRAGIYHEISRREMEHVMLLAGLEAGFPAAGIARRQIDAAFMAHDEMVASKTL
ncbi:MAG TPA: hypothetical protein DIS83_03550 [Rhodobiaceae bacterium]|mgnify:FL=1|nr:hypothetical protein [Rhodobiaceae bacterium]